MTYVCILKTQLHPLLTSILLISQVLFRCRFFVWNVFSLSLMNLFLCSFLAVLLPIDVLLYVNSDLDL